MAINLDWENLGFSYRNLPFRYIARFKDGKWSAGELTGDNQLHISESSPALHYGQQGFEGLKAYRTKDGSIQLFRPDQNAARLQKTARRLCMAEVSTEMFISLLYLAEHRLGLKAIEGEVYAKDLGKFVEAGACGTAAIISPIGRIDDGEDSYIFHSETEVGPTVKRLYDELVGIQFGDVEAPEGWIVKVD